MPEPSGQAIVNFGNFEADLRTGELRRDGSKIRLQEQPFQILALLLETPGEIVTREELRTRLWPADTFVDFDHGLNAAIKRLRDALGDSAENPRFVETLARRGYRFVAPVNPSGRASQDPAKHKRVLTSPPPRVWRIAVAATIMLSLGIATGWHAARRSAASVRLTERRLTANAADDPVTGSAISPDGKYLAFSDRNGLFLRILATGETNSVALPDAFKARPVSWFPDGNHLLASRSTLSDEKSSAWSISVLGASPRQIMGSVEARSVSSDGRQVAVIRGEMLNQEIWVVSTDGAASRKVFGDPGDIFGSVVWSPDGSRLAFVRYLYRPGYHDGNDEIAIGICDVATGQANIVLSDSRLGEALAWSPDGRLIYALDEPPPNQRDSNLWALQVDARTGHQRHDPQRLTGGPDRKRWLSLSSDGKFLSFVHWNGEPHVYVGEVAHGANALGSLKRLSLDEGRNFPYTWTLDGKALFFTSDRAGGRRLFRQRPDQPAPDLVVGGADTVLLARLNPDGSEIMYLTLPPQDSPSHNARIMRQPVAGGTPQFVLEAEGISNFQCARVPSTVCLLSQAWPDHLSFVRFDPVSGKQSEVTRIDSAGVPKYNWSLSPDGFTLAIAQWRRSQIPAEIELRSLRGGTSRKLSVPGWAAITAIDWAGDGRTLLASASNPSGTQALLRVDLRGKATPLWENADKDVGWGISSPDGRRIALWQANGISNAWLLQGF